VSRGGGSSRQVIAAIRQIALLTDAPILSTGLFAPANVSVFGDRLATRSDMQLFVDPSYVSIDSRDADFEALRDFLIKVTTCEQVQHFLFARGKCLP